MKLQWDYEQAAHDFRRNLRIQIAKHPHLEKAVERIWLCVVWVLKVWLPFFLNLHNTISSETNLHIISQIFVTPIPSVARRLPKELNVSASALSLVYIVVFPIVLTQTLDYAHSTPNVFTSFQLAGYFFLFTFSTLKTLYSNFKLLFWYPSL